MQNNIIENLKDLFKYSSENVVITDYDFNILWSNKSEDYFLFGGKSFRSKAANIM